MAKYYGCRAGEQAVRGTGRAPLYLLTRVCAGASLGDARITRCFTGRHCDNRLQAPGYVIYFKIIIEPPATSNLQVDKSTPMDAPAETGRRGRLWPI
ncbi:hypothetical protein EVAR_101736_1, partial [Eumeta japonica]